jgi:hypothetical protein
MALSDVTLSADSVCITLLIFADFDDLPLRAAYAPQRIFVPMVLDDADADAAGQTFDVINPDVLRLEPVRHEDGGTDTMQFVLFADKENPELLEAIEDPSLYLGRRVRVWMAVYGSDGVVLEIQPLYRGYMTVPAQRASADSFIIAMEAENWASLLQSAQARTYLNSYLYDNTDQAGPVSRTLSGGSQAANLVGASSGGGGGGRDFGSSEFVKLL